MKKKNRVAIIMVVLLGALSFWFIVKNNKSTISEEMRAFAVKDTAAVTRIFIADHKGQSVTLERNGLVWTVNKSFTARQDVVKTLLTTIAKIDVKEPVSKKAHDNV